MIYLLFKQYPNIMMGAGVIFTLFATAALTQKLKDRLPADEGRDFAVDGKLSKGKPRGAGIIFVLCFIAGVLLFSPMFRFSLKEGCEQGIYLVLVFAEMLTGYLDDRAETPWGRVKKGIFDLAVSLAFAVAFIWFNGSSFDVLETSINVPMVLWGAIIAFVCWMSINVVNCADGVDGLSGTLVMITLLGFIVADYSYGRMPVFRYQIVFFMAALLAYLWFNAGPSILMMGDAGSRAMGIFICITAFKSGHPLLFIPFALVLILDGGLGLFKVSVIKLTKKKNFMNKLRTPLHDHVRKNLENKWSNNQCVTRFAIIQTVIVIAVIYVFCR